MPAPRLIRMLTTGLLCLVGHAAWADSATRTICVYDPVGASGPIIEQFQDYVIFARDHGVVFDLRPYTSEEVVASDFKAGRCDAAGLTGIRVKQFVDFAGSLDMVGGLQTYEQLHTAIRVMASDKAAPLMHENGYEIAGIVPGGKVFLFSRDKRFLDSLEAAAGKKVAVIGYDRQARVVANVAGASPVPATIASFGPLFNNHSVDMAYAPSIAYRPLELYKGLGESGGVADFVLGMLSLQMVVHRDRFPADFPAASRRWALDNAWDRVIPRIRQADREIPEHYWVPIDGQRETKYRGMLREIRQRLWDQGWYNHRMQHLLKKIRCASDGGLAECSLDSEGGAVN
ncbi:putative solute-binding protein [Salinisphaera sp. T31B1]|uniref:putative solute-binding protein n=1 Tax=Salinisphaera sp. T31B1 TaxID=727963 RepID=UPI00333E7527